MKNISIISINLNNSTGLERTILSVINQTFKNYEYIIVDGSSNDASVDIIKKYETFIDYWVSEKDNGIYNAMNKGIEASNGEYLIFLNSGDCLYNSKVLENVSHYLDKDDIVFGDAIFSATQPDGNKNFMLRKTHKNIKPIHFIRHALPSHQSIFFSRALFKEHGKYDEDFTIIGDAEFITRIFFRSKSFSAKYIPCIISVFDIMGISNNIKMNHIKNLERKKIYSKYMPPFYYILNRLYQFVFTVKRWLNIYQTKPLFNKNLNPQKTKLLEIIQEDVTINTKPKTKWLPRDNAPLPKKQFQIK